MKLRKLVAILLSVLMVFGLTSMTGSALSLNDSVDALKTQFVKGAGPEVDGYRIDYRYFSPVGENDTTKYPVVVWLHGMGDGATEGKQVTEHEIAKWTSDEYQSRFKKSGGAFIIAPRSLEEKGLYWSDDLIYPLRAAIDDFIAQNKANVDISRIYVGGYSMGGKMTLKMAVAYPEFFAAAFPICPAWTPSTAQTEKIADMPVWLTSCVIDPLVNYFSSVRPTWNNIVAVSNAPESCRFTTLTVSCYANGVPNVSAHHSWYSVTNDMFSDKNGDYPMMSTVNGLGEDVKLAYPEGMISWLSGFESDYDGAPATDSGNEEAKGETIMKNLLQQIKDFIVEFFAYLKGLF